jgi:hypothetical protein
MTRIKYLEVYNHDVVLKRRTELQGFTEFLRKVLYNLGPSGNYMYHVL